MTRISLLLFALLTSISFAGVITGKVIKVADGDTITILVDKTQVKVRLAGIDAPESKQDFGNKSKHLLASHVAGKVVKVDVSGKDRYGRSIGTIYAGKVNINASMVRAGMAWQYLKYDKSKELRDAQAHAKIHKLGLWSQGVAIAPWEYRANKKQKAAIKKTGDKAGLLYWLNTTSNSRHNSTCKWYKQTKRGRACKANEGHPCGQCGG